MMKPLIGVYGAAGSGRGILPLLREQYPEIEIVFVDDGNVPSCVNGHDVLTWEAFINSEARTRFVSIAIADSKIRQRLAGKCAEQSIPLIEARAKTVVEFDEVSIGDGACLSPFVTLTSNIKVGRCFHANLYSYVEHDCVIGDFVTLAPGAKINGNVVIDDHAYIGSGAVIRQGKPGRPLTIGEGAVVGMGAVVTSDVPFGATVVGNPARLMKKD